MYPVLNRALRELARVLSLKPTRQRTATGRGETVREGKAQVSRDAGRPPRLL